MKKKAPIVFIIVSVFAVAAIIIISAYRSSESYTDKHSVSSKLRRSSLAFLERGVTDGFGITLYILEMFFIQDFHDF